MIKTLIIIATALTISLTASSQTDRLPENPPEWWYEKNDYEKYQLLKATHDIAVEQNVKLRQMNSDLSDDIDFDTETLKLIEENKKNLEQYKPFIPTWGVSLSASGSILANLHEKGDYAIKPEIDINIAVYRFLLQGRLFFLFGGSLQIHRDIGGGVELGVGVIIK